MIVTIHNHVITRIPRFEVSHDKHHTWNLHIKNVQKEDKGHYMCQINTDPMLSNVGHLNVVGTFFETRDHFRLNLDDFRRKEPFNSRSF